MLGAAVQRRGKRQALREMLPAVLRNPWVLAVVALWVVLIWATLGGAGGSTAAALLRSGRALRCMDSSPDGSPAAQVCIPAHCTGLTLAQRPDGSRSVRISDTLTMSIYGSGELISDSILNSGQPYCPGPLTTAFRAAAEKRERLRFLDVGSNIGSCGLLAASLGHAAVAIEPMSANVAQIRASAGLSRFAPGGSLTLFPIAASEVADLMVLYKERHNSGNNLVVRASEAGKVDLSRFGSFGADAVYDEDRICAQPLDEVAAAHSVPDAFNADLVKIDVQGHEIEALRSMAGILARRTARMVFVEVWPTLLAAKGTDCMEVLAIATKAGYQLVRDGTQMDADKWRESCGSPVGFDVELVRK